jgi:hypothetical protein
MHLFGTRTSKQIASMKSLISVGRRKKTPLALPPKLITDGILIINQERQTYQKNLRVRVTAVARAVQVRDLNPRPPSTSRVEKARLLDTRSATQSA